MTPLATTPWPGVGRVRSLAVLLVATLVAVAFASAASATTRSRHGQPRDVGRHAVETIDFPGVATFPEGIVATEDGEFFVTGFGDGRPGRCRLCPA